MTRRTRARTEKEKHIRHDVAHSPSENVQLYRPNLQANMLTLQRVAGNQAVNALLEVDSEYATPVASGALKGGGQPLDTAIRTDMEDRLGQDFSQVRLHTDMKAAGSADALGAEAYTRGTHIVFGTGGYRPDSISGRAVLAHELVHVTQQRIMGKESTPSLSQKGDPFEQQAEQISDLAINSRRFSNIEPGVFGLSSPVPNIGNPPSIQRKEKASTPDEMDELTSKIIAVRISGFHEAETDALMKNAREFDARLHRDHRPLTQAALTSGLVTIVNTLQNREENFVGQEPFLPEKIQSWFESAGQPAPAMASLLPPEPSQIGTELTSHELSDIEKAAEPVGNLPKIRQLQESMLNTAGQSQLGGGYDVQFGLANLQSISIRQAKNAIANGIGRGTSTTPEEGDSISLFNSAGQIWYVANQIYLLDRRGHIIPGTFHYEHNFSNLEPGTYFFGPFLLNRPSGSFSVNTMIRVDGQPRLVPNPVLAVPHMITQFLPLTTEGKSVLGAKAGIGIIVAPHGHPVKERDTVGAAIEKSRHHMWWAIRSELMLRAMMWQERPGEVIAQKAFGIAQGELAKVIPQVRIAMGVYQGIQELEWLAEHLKIAGYARTEDEIDIAAQSIARRIAQEAIERAEGKAIGKAIGITGKVLGKKGQTKKTSSPKPKKQDQLLEKRRAPGKRPVRSADQDVTGKKSSAEEEKPSLELRPKAKKKVGEEEETSTTKVPKPKGWQRVSSEAQNWLNKIGVADKAKKSLSRAGDDIIRAVNRFHTVMGFDEVIKDYLAGGPQQEGARFVMRFVEANFDDKAKTTMFFEMPGIPRVVGSSKGKLLTEPSRFHDVWAAGIKYEFKSVSEIRNAIVRGRGDGKFGQLQKDLISSSAGSGGDINAMLSELGRHKWVFDSRKMANEGLKHQDVVKQLGDLLFGGGLMEGHPYEKQIREKLAEIVQFWP